MQKHTKYKFFFVFCINIFCLSHKTTAMKIISHRELLYWAAKNNHYDFVKSLLKKGASTEWTDLDGLTALHIACQATHDTLNVKIIKKLLSYGAKVNAQTKSTGDTPLHYVAGQEQPSIQCSHIIKYLIEYGANPRISNKKNMTALDIASKDIFQLLEHITQYTSSVLSQTPEKMNEAVETYRQQFLTWRVPVRLAHVAVSWNHENVLTYLAEKELIIPQRISKKTFDAKANFADLIALAVHQNNSSILKHLIKLSGKNKALVLEDIAKRYPDQRYGNKILSLLITHTKSSLKSNNNNKQGKSNDSSKTI